MRGLLEAIFDKDNIEKDVEMGVLYKLSDRYAHYNGFSNDPEKFINLFEEKELKKIGGRYKYVDPDHGFVGYWNNIYGSSVGDIVDIILRCPAETFMDKNNNVVEKGIKDYLKRYIKRSHYNDISIFIRRFESHGLIEISIYDDIKKSSPNSIKITLEKI